MSTSQSFAVYKVLPHSVSYLVLRKIGFIIPILQVRKLKLKVVKGRV